jgi:hypothetical protein
MRLPKILQGFSNQAQVIFRFPLLFLLVFGIVIHWPLFDYFGPLAQGDSGRMVSEEPGLGTFGRDYCPLLKKYLDDNFEPSVEFGDWSKKAEWSGHHATRILKRKTPLLEGTP